MGYIASMFRAVEFIEHNLRRPVTIADVADAVSYSLYHFSRVFNKVIHHTPYDYLMRRRLSESARELIDTDTRIIDIALEYQFSSPEAYSRAFKRIFGVQPNRWRKQESIDERFLMSRLTLAHIQHLNKGSYLRPVLEERDVLQVAGVMALVRDDPDVIPRLWEILAQQLEGAQNRDKLEHYHGIAWYPQGWEKRGFLYMAAVEGKQALTPRSDDVCDPHVAGTELLGTSPTISAGTESLDAMPSAMVIKTIPALVYARFIHKGPRKDLGLTLDYVYQTWLPKSGKRLSCPLEIEDYGQGAMGPDPESSRIAIYIPIE